LYIEKSIVVQNNVYLPLTALLTLYQSVLGYNKNMLFACSLILYTEMNTNKGVGPGFYTKGGRIMHQQGNMYIARDTLRAESSFNLLPEREKEEDSVEVMYFLI